jgi:predicted GH43/DUF377 family glycosyl hydrolase
MLKIKDEGIILEKTDLDYESKSVFNPACIQVGDVTHMFYRAVNQNNISSIGYCQMVDNKVVKRFDRPILFPEFDYEKKGVEDPRITLLDGIYYLFYTAFDGKNALIAYATSSDLINFTKHGLISPKFSYDEAEDIFRWSGIRERYSMFEILYKEKEGKTVKLFEKDSSLFPQKIGGKFALIHRILPGIQVIYFDNFSDLTDNHWRDYLKNLGNFIALDPLFWFESRNVGGGAPPIETEEGWLIIYHAVEDTPLGRIYHAAAALFSPEAPWEKSGIIDNVVFPTGTIVKDGRLYIYYGAADTCIGAKSVLLRDLLDSLLESPQG